MKKIILISYLSVSLLFFGQVLQVNNTLTPEQLVQNILAGSGVQISNVTFNGVAGTTVDEQCGDFDGTGTNVGINTGVILATGSVNVATGPNDQGGASEGSATTIVSDADLDAISTNTLNDLAILEFDFIPVGNIVSFKYVFSSEEYNEYVCSGYNDVFGFFISGPGINGPYTNNAENIAIIPGTSTAVAINTVNLGVSGSNGTASTCEAIDPNWESYNVYYNNNLDNYVQYDGMTQVLTAVSPVQCGQTYHIKLAIADAGDGSFDSGVFLEANSLISQPVNLNLATITGSDTIYEGNCSAADFILSRPGCFNDQALTLNYTFSGTAIENVDYSISPAGNSITFPPFEDTVILSMTGIVETPNLVEVSETIIFTATYTNNVGVLVTITDTLVMAEDAIIGASDNAPLTVCPEDSLQTIVTPIGGTAPYTYDWQDSQTNDTAYFSILTPGTLNFNVLITDICGFQFIHNAVITYPDPGPLTFVPNDSTLLCPNTNVILSAAAINGVQPYVFEWNYGTIDTITNFILDSITVNNTSKTYTITVTDFCGFESTGTQTLNLTQTLFITGFNTISSYLCQPTGTATPIIEGENGVITYIWKDSAQTIISNNNILQNAPTGTYYLTIVDEVCLDSNTTFIDFIPNPIADFTTGEQETDPPSVILVSNQSQYATNYEWDFGNGETNATPFDNNQYPTYQDTGHYMITLRAISGPCIDEISKMVEILRAPTVTISDIFSPNKDGKNDFFTLVPAYLAEFNFQIFNRWGNLVFEGDLSKPTWDGTTEKDKEVPEGVYFYTYFGKGVNGEVLEGHGNIQLTR